MGGYIDVRAKRELVNRRRFRWQLSSPSAHSAERACDQSEDHSELRTEKLRISSDGIHGISITRMRCNSKVSPGDAIMFPNQSAYVDVSVPRKPCSVWRRRRVVVSSLACNHASPGSIPVPATPLTSSSFANSQEWLRGQSGDHLSSALRS